MSDYNVRRVAGLQGRLLKGLSGRRSMSQDFTPRRKFRVYPWEGETWKYQESDFP